jgi:hypothetical protein
MIEVAGKIYAVRNEEKILKLFESQFDAQDFAYKAIDEIQNRWKKEFEKLKKSETILRNSSKQKMKKKIEELSSLSPDDDPLNPRIEFVEKLAELSREILDLKREIENDYETTSNMNFSKWLQSDWADRQLLIEREIARINVHEFSLCLDSKGGKK